eukprot:scaffold127988_cov30-Tisochrysis_lutea.AAC.6
MATRHKATIPPQCRTTVKPVEHQYSINVQNSELSIHHTLSIKRSAGLARLARSLPRFPFPHPYPPHPPDGPASAAPRAYRIGRTRADTAEHATPQRTDAAPAHSQSAARHC